MKEIRMYQPDISLKEIFRASKSLYYGWLGYGESVNVFKQKIANKLKLDHNKCIMTGNATNALFILFKVLNLKDEVIVPSISYAGIPNAIKESNAKIKICDVEEDLNPSLYNIKKVYNKNCRAVIVNNYGGVQIEELYKIKNFCKEKNMLLIEDRASNLLGGKGNHLADFVIYSFSSMKIITTIEGGMIYINNSKYNKYLNDIKLLTYLGINKNIMSNVFDYYQNQDIFIPGNKSVISSIGAEIGIAQIDRLNEFIEKRLENEKLYFKLLQNNFYVPKINEYGKNWYWIRTNNEKKKKIIEKFKENNINVNFKYNPIHMTTLYKTNNNQKLIKSEEMSEQIVCLPIHTKLKKEQIINICNILNKIK